MIKTTLALFAWVILISSPTQAVTLIYSNDVMGELEPCGCRVEPHGGLIRKAGLLNTLNDQELLQLDAGNLLFGFESDAPALRAQAEIQAGYLIQAHNALHHDATIPSPKDFSLGFGVFEKLRKKAKFPFLAANLYNPQGKPWLKTYEIFKKKSEDKTIKIAVIGLVGEKLNWPHGLRATSALAAAQRWIPFLRKRADLVIALTYQGLEQDQALAQSVPGIDLIIGGESLSFLDEPKKISQKNSAVESGTFIFQSSFRNQFVGVVPLEKPFSPKDHRLVALDASYDLQESAVKKTVSKIVDEFKKKVALTNEKEAAQAQRESKKLFTDSKFHTFPKCAGCHMTQFDFWRKTPHMKALQVLIDAGQASNKECLSCHTVGLGDPLGFQHVKALAQDSKNQTLPISQLAFLIRGIHQAPSVETPIQWSEADPNPQPVRAHLSQLKRSFAPVQCENCHTPGAGHPFEGIYSKSVQSETCLKCHTRDRAPGWYSAQGKPDWALIAQKKTLITCPADQ